MLGRILPGACGLSPGQRIFNIIIDARVGVFVDLRGHIRRHKTGVRIVVAIDSPLVGTGHIDDTSGGHLILEIAAKILCARGSCL